MIHRTIPKHLYNDFTMNGQIPVIDYWFNDGNSETPDQMKQRLSFYKKEKILDLVIKAYKKEGIGYIEVDKLLYQAFEKYSIQGKTCLIIGSEKPNYESICLAYGGTPMVTEYRYLETDHPGIKILSQKEYEESNNVFDCCLSISSVEHSGLGRYGENLNPFADLEHMQELKRKLKKGGLLFLAIPIGKDLLYWNACRQFGSLRLPLILKGWEIVETYGFSQIDLFKEYGYYYDSAGNFRWHYYQPLFILRNV